MPCLSIPDSHLPCVLARPLSAEDNGSDFSFAAVWLLCDLEEKEFFVTRASRSCGHCLCLPWHCKGAGLCVVPLCEGKFLGS